MARIGRARVPKRVKDLALMALDPHNDGFVATKAREDLEITKTYIEGILAQLSNPQDKYTKGPAGPTSFGSGG